MSLEAMLWATRCTELDDGPWRTLVLIADYAGADGYCWPSIGTLATRAGKHRSTIIRHRDLLEAEGYIVRLAGDLIPARVAGNRRPVVWQVNTARGRTHATPELSTDTVSRGRTRATPEPVDNSLGVAPVQQQGSHPCDPNQLENQSATGSWLVEGTRADSNGITSRGLADCRAALRAVAS